MKLSIITINLNNSNGLKKTIKSVIEQDHKDFEFIVIDGASNDGSIDVIKKYSGKITHWVSEKDPGIYNAMNKGIALAKGEYCLFLNSGDSLIANDILTKIFSQKITEDILFGDIMIDKNGSMQQGTYLPDKIDLSTFLKGSIPHQATFIKKELFEKYGSYDENLKIVSDWKFFLQLFLNGNITQKNIKKVVTFYDVKGISNSNVELRNSERKKVISEIVPPEALRSFESSDSTFKKNKIFIVYYNYKNTSGNHAGMAHFAREFKKRSKHDCRLIKMPENLSKLHSSIRRIWLMGVCRYIQSFSDKNTKVLLMEYLSNSFTSYQMRISKELKKLNLSGQISGIIHIPAWHLEESFEKKYLTESIANLDEVIVFGSSLKPYLLQYKKTENIHCTFHYADLNYYKPVPQKNKKLKVLSIGSLNRDFDSLKEIISDCPEIDFHICMGHKDLTQRFKTYSNVTTHPYLEENQLLNIMQQSDVSLSVLKDSIGSNAITSSMACGLVNVVSDVGSVRDYVSANDSFLCADIGQFINALKKLNSDRELLEKLKENTILKSKDLSLERSIEWFDAYFNN